MSLSSDTTTIYIRDQPSTTAVIVEKMGKKKSFIDRSKASTFHLLHRSQRDVAEDHLEEGDVNSSGMILWPTDGKLPTSSQSGQSTSLGSWRAKLSAAGLLEEDTNRYVKEISTDGVFLGIGGKVADASLNARSQPLTEETLEVERQFESIPLTSEFMDDEIAQVLFGDADVDEFEDLNDEFILDAAQEPDDAKGSDGFDYDEHIRILMEKAKREREAVDGENKDTAFFANLTALHEMDEIDSWGGEYDAGTDVPGTAPKMTPEEERALCAKFEETLLEYDSDDIGEGADEDIEVEHPLDETKLHMALKDFQEECQDDIYAQGSSSNFYSREVKPSGGSGFSALIGKQMVHASELNASDKPPDEVNEAVDDILSVARERLLQPPVAPPAEEILIDGKSYYSERERNPFDCESVLSTHSNLDNNPTTIGASRSRRRRRQNTNPLPGVPQPSTAIRLSNKTGLPIGIMGPVKDEEDDYVGLTSAVSSVNMGLARNKKETVEEKRSRKMALKHDKKLARVRRKAAKEVFEEEFRKRAVDVATTGTTVHVLS